MKDSLLTTLKIKDKINYRLRKWKKENIIDPSIADTLTTSGTTPGIMYGLPKIHKDGTPSRPILSATNTSSCNMSKYLVGIVEHLSTNNYTLKNSYKFTNFISKVTNTNQLIMCSSEISELETEIEFDQILSIKVFDSLYILVALFINGTSANDNIMFIKVFIF